MRLTRKNEFAEQTGMTHRNNKPIYLDGKNFNESLDTFREIVNKLGQLEDIEEELGIDLILLGKAFKQGYIFLDIKENNKGISKIEKFEVGGILFDNESKVWRLTNNDTYDGAYWGSLATNKNYGKTWALTKEELSNGNS